MLQPFLLLQKEIALYTASKFNGDFCWFDIDGDIDALFKVKFMKTILLSLVLIMFLNSKVS